MPESECVMTIFRRSLGSRRAKLATVGLTEEREFGKSVQTVDAHDEPNPKTSTCQGLFKGATIQARSR